MAIKTKFELKSESEATYLTNGQGAISAASVRAFNEDLIDTVMTEPKSGWIQLNVVENTENLTINALQVKYFGDFYLLYLYVLGIPAGGAVIQVDNFGFGGFPVYAYVRFSGGDMRISTNDTHISLIPASAEGNYQGMILLPHGNVPPIPE
jgi:hypothetical protein